MGFENLRYIDLDVDTDLSNYIPPQQPTTPAPGDFPIMHRVLNTTIHGRLHPHMHIKVVSDMLLPYFIYVFMPYVYVLTTLV